MTFKKNISNFYINGKWVKPHSSETMSIINPATEESVGTLALGDTLDVEEAIGAAHKAFASFSQTTPAERLALLNQIRIAYEARLPDLAVAITMEMGAPNWVAEKAQAPLGLNHLKVAIDLMGKFEFSKSVGDSLIAMEPVGVCALITPWNWPASQAMLKIVPALAAGCTIVLKPSEFSPLSAQILAEIMEEAKVPEGVFNLIHGTGPVVGTYLSSHPKIDMVSFTGSTRAGIDIATKAAPTIKRVHQELGGKSPNIILPSADFEKAVANGVKGLMFNSGQSCSAPSRLLIPQEKMAEAKMIASEAAAKLSPGAPDTKAFIGPVVNHSQFKKIQDLIQSGIDEGATLVTGGLGRPDGLERGYYIRPTIFADTVPDMTIVNEEICGPVLVIQGYKDLEDAISLANDTPYGLAAYIQGSNPDELLAVAKQIRAGQVFLNGNGLDLNDLYAPFGGFKASGNGREWGEAGLEAFLEPKALIGYKKIINS